MFCVECGKEGPIFRNGSCITCYLKNKQFSKGPAYIDILTCATCDAHKYKNTWVTESFESLLHRLIRENFTISNELQNMQITTTYKHRDKTVACNVVISGNIDTFQISEEHPVMVRFRRETCDTCSRQSGGYYESILQIRSDKRKLGKEELKNIQDFVQSFVESAREKGNRALFIADIAFEHGGIDFYLSEKGSALTMAKKLYEQFGGELKQSARSSGMKDSRQLYRMTYLIRFPAYRKGDFIMVDDTLYLISSLHENTVHVLDLATWMKRIFAGKDLQNARVLGDEFVKEMILVSQSDREVQLMNPSNYEIVHVRKPEPVTFTNEKVKIITIEDQIFLLPDKTTTSK